MNSAWTVIVRSVGVVGIALVAYGVVVSATRMALLSYAVTAAILGVGFAWALFAE